GHRHAARATACAVVLAARGRGDGPVAAREPLVPTKPARGGRGILTLAEGECPDAAAVARHPRPPRPARPRVLQVRLPDEPHQLLHVLRHRALWRIRSNITGSTLSVSVRRHRRHLSRWSDR